MKKRNTRHYSPEEWVDFAMDQTPSSQKVEMQHHLEAGCQPCAQLLSLWTRVGQIAAREQSLHPPDSAVHHVRAAFASLSKAQNAEHTPLIPRLAFDSLWQPALAGIRSAYSGPRKLLYKTKDITIEMHVEAESKSERMTLTGQLTIGSLQGQALRPIPVVISGENGKVASTLTNTFGEFHLSYLPESNLQITFALAGGQTAVIPIDDRVKRAFNS